jgi:mannose/fructose/N-acetylgalactosamine-specific phosphotransferase system component IID
MDTPTPIQGHPAVKGLVAAVLGAIAIHWAGTEVILGGVFGFMFFLVGHVNGHAYGYKLGREEKEKVEDSSQREGDTGVND